MQTAPRMLAVSGLIAALASGCAGPGATHRSAALHTGYAYVFLAAKAERLQDEHYYKALKKWQQARKHYVKGYEAGLAALEKRHPGFAAAINRMPAEAIAMTTADDVDLLYWTAASLGATIGLSKDRPGWIVRLPQVGSLAFRVTELDPGYGDGAGYQLLMVYEASRPAMMGGSVKLAKHYYKQALNYAGESSAALFVAYSETICVQEQDRKTFVAMLERALAVKTGGTMNKLSRRRARWLLDRIDELFI